MARNRKQCATVEPVDCKIPAKPQQFAILSCTERLVHLLAHHIRRLSKQWFTHIFLLSMLIGYAALGGLIFWTVEGYNERRVKNKISSTKEDVQKTLWNMSLIAQDYNEWLNLSAEPLKRLEREVKGSGHAYHPDKKVWSFWSAVFYSGTVFTTIGYGNIAPSTNIGRGLTIVYAIFGIPLLCTVLADFGKLLTRCIKFFWFGMHRCSQTGSCRRRALITKNTEVSSRAFLKRYEAENKLQVDSNNSCLESHAMDKEGEEEEGEEGGGDVEAVSNPPVPYVIDDEFNLPVSVALIILFAYIMLGALIFFQWENWTYFESMYFVFISMSTIGFGDYFPEHPKFMMAAFAYLLFGLALTSMCINVVQETLTVTFNNASRKLKKRIGITDKSTGPELLELATHVEIAPVHQPISKIKQRKGDIEAS